MNSKLTSWLNNWNRAATADWWSWWFMGQGRTAMYTSGSMAQVSARWVQPPGRTGDMAVDACRNEEFEGAQPEGHGMHSIVVVLSVL